MMAVASHPVISNRNHGSDLPPSWRTLYELTKVEPAALCYSLPRSAARSPNDPNLIP
jgi:hypothetical protein